MFTEPCVPVCVCAVQDFEEVLSYFFRLQRLHLFQEEHEDYSNMVENLTEELYVLSKEATERVIAEHVREYMAERLQPGRRRIKDPLEWWSTNHVRWPMVAAVARHSLCVPASSGCSEKGFSSTGHIVRARRARLGDEKIEELSHLSNNPI